VNENKRLAVLVDADNVSAQWATAIFKEIATFGDATVRRIYGDFASQGLRPWRKVLQDHALIPHHQPAYTKGKNSSDIALAIDAMDLLHSRHVEGFVLVSSDSDFTRLASRIREQGLEVIGIGEERTPESLRKACKRFIFLENLEQEDPSSAGQAGATAAKESASNSTKAAKARKTQPPSKVVPLVLEAMRTVEDEWVPVGLLGSLLHTANPDFDPRTYGCAKLSDLLEKAGAFEVNRSPHAEVRRRNG